jgi:hypothetical protein
MARSPPARWRWPPQAALNADSRVGPSAYVTSASHTPPASPGLPVSCGVATGVPPLASDCPFQPAGTSSPDPSRRGACLKRHRWPIVVVLATSMGHRCRFPPGAGAGRGLAGGAGVVSEASGAHGTGRPAGCRGVTRRRAPGEGGPASGCGIEPGGRAGAASPKLPGLRRLAPGDNSKKQSTSTCRRGQGRGLLSEGHFDDNRSPEREVSATVPKCRHPRTRGPAPGTNAA